MERQSLNDNGMATLFKVNNISAALELQDETDREKIFLMGASEANGVITRKGINRSIDEPQF
jgi:hypothetical protein